MRCTFVILHYMASDVTSRSINAVLALHREDDISVVVVDNASPDGSGPPFLVHRVFPPLPSEGILFF